MGVKQCHKPPMTGNGLYEFMPSSYGDLWKPPFFILRNRPIFHIACPIKPPPLRPLVSGAPGHATAGDCDHERRSFSCLAGGQVAPVLGGEPC